MASFRLRFNQHKSNSKLNLNHFVLLIDKSPIIEILDNKPITSQTEETL